MTDRVLPNLMPPKRPNSPATARARKYLTNFSQQQASLPRERRLYYRMSRSSIRNRLQRLHGHRWGSSRSGMHVIKKPNKVRILYCQLFFFI